MCGVQRSFMSEPIVMVLFIGWYVGAICKDPDCDGMIILIGTQIT